MPKVTVSEPTVVNIPIEMISEKLSSMKHIITRMSAKDFLNLKAIFEAKEDKEKQMDPKELKPAVPGAAPVKPVEEKPEMPEAKPVEPKKEEPKLDKKPCADEAVCKAIKMLEELKKVEGLEGEKEDVAKIDAIIKELEGVKKPELKKEEPKKEEPKKEEPKKEEPKLDMKKEEPKAEMPKVEPKPEMKKEEPKKMAPVNPFKASNIATIFIKKDAMPKSKWVFIDKASNRVILRAELGELFGENLESKLPGASTEEFANTLVAAIAEKGLSKAAVFEAVAKYSPCYPTHTKMQAPAISSHDKSKEEATDHAKTDDEVAPAVVKAAAAAPSVEKKAEGTVVSVEPVVGPTEAAAEPVVEATAVETPMETPVVASEKTEVVKTAEKTETDGLSSDNPGGSQIKEDINHSADGSGHDKCKSKAPTEYDTKIAALEAKLASITEENRKLSAKVTDLNGQSLLAEKMAKCKQVVEKMAQKGLLSPKEEYRMAEIKAGKSVDQANKIAFRKTVEDHVKKFLAMDEIGLDTFASSIENIEKKAEKSSSVLKDPIRVSANMDEKSDDVSRLSDKLNGQWD